MLSKFNQFIEKWMALVTPACLLFGVLFPDVAKHGLPYVSLVFAFMTFTGALKSDFHDMARVLKRPFPLLACLGVLHVLLPVLPAAWDTCSFREMTTLSRVWCWNFPCLQPWSALCG